ncbi:MAG: HEAT repeat domain-containing protein [Candidatus Competibacteraceae bacterium]
MNDDIAAHVNTAFAAARMGNYALISQLGEQQGAQVIPYLAPYLRDADERVRLQAVALLTTFTDPRAVPLLGLALADSQQDMRRRAALALYERYDPIQLAARPEIGDALRASVNQGNDAAAAVLLLGYFPGEPTQAALTALNERVADGQTELDSWAPVVPVKLVIAVSQSRLGDQKARLALLRKSADGTLAEREFLLSVLREVDAPEVLHALAQTLNDTREVSGDLPAGVSPRRRLCDKAVVAFVRRLELPINFQISESRRFTPAEIASVRRAIAASLPNS